METFETCLGEAASGLCVLNVNEYFSEISFDYDIPEFVLNKDIYVNGDENLNKLDENRFIIMASNKYSESPKISQIITI